MATQCKLLYMFLFSCNNKCLLHTLCWSINSMNKLAGCDPPYEWHDGCLVHDVHRKQGGSISLTRRLYIDNLNKYDCVCIVATHNNCSLYMCHLWKSQGLTVLKISSWHPNIDKWNLNKACTLLLKNLWFNRHSFFIKLSPISFMRKVKITTKIHKNPCTCNLNVIKNSIFSENAAYTCSCLCWFMSL